MVLSFKSILAFKSAHWRVASSQRLKASVNGQLPEDEPTNGQANGSKKKKAKRRKRENCDFPSFAYDPSNRYKQKLSDKQQQLLIRFRDSDDDKERVFRTRSPRTVSVPLPERNEPSILKKIVLSILGPSLEYGSFSNPDTMLPVAIRNTRLLTERAYARQEPFAVENITVPPSLDDLAARPRDPFEEFWISNTARGLSFLVSYVSFPWVTKFLDVFVTMEPQQLDEITSKFAPGISILYGTFISLTLSILYNRKRDIQDNVSVECSLITVLLRTVLGIFRDERERAIEASQIAADQIRTLVRSSRGAELMLLMYSDPYARLLEIVDRHEDKLFKLQGESGRACGRISYARDLIKDLNKVRAARLSDESLALPPTHFLILNILTLLILLGYTISILPTVPRGGNPSNESSLLFGVLTTVYILFFNFANDLNNPFRGVYQIRRSAAASHLLEAKWLIANHPYLQGEVDFEEVEEVDAGVQINTPGLGCFYFERDEFYVDEGIYNSVDAEDERPSVD